MNDHPLEDLHEFISEAPLYDIIEYALLCKYINRNRVNEIVVMCSDHISNERRIRGGKFRIDKMMKDVLEISKNKLEIDMDDIMDEIGELHEEAYPKNIYILMKEPLHGNNSFWPGHP